MLGTNDSRPISYLTDGAASRTFQATGNKRCGTQRIDSDVTSVDRTDEVFFAYRNNQALVGNTLELKWTK